MTSSLPRTSPTGLAVIAVACLALYAGILRDLGTTWMEDENYAHGVLVPPIAAFLVWRNRAALARLTPAPSFVGVLIIAAALCVLILGSAAIELFLTRVSLVGVLGGLVVYLWGWAYLRVLLFPLAFLLLMVPLPAIVFNEIAFPLQLVASRMGVSALQVLDIPVLREGNIIVLATTTLEVAEACSGIRSLI
jgi:exosortase